MKILVAEEDHDTRELLIVALVGWGHEVRVAASAEQAWQILARDDAPRASIVGLRLPDGAALCRRIRQTPHLRSSFVLLVTSADDEPTAVQAMTAGADDFLARPLDLAGLHERLRLGDRMLRLQLQLETERLLLLRDVWERSSSLPPSIRTS